MSHGNQVVCVSGGWESAQEAEHGYWEARDLVGCYPYLGTSFEGEARVVVAGADDPRDLPEKARVFSFPGLANVVGVVRVGDLLLLCAVDEVRGVSDLHPSLDAVVDTRGHIRPLVLGGRLVLTVRPGEGLAYLPLDQPAPQRCCAEH